MSGNEPRMFGMRFDHVCRSRGSECYKLVTPLFSFVLKEGDDRWWTARVFDRTGEVLFEKTMLEGPNVGAGLIKKQVKGWMR